MKKFSLFLILIFLVISTVGAVALSPEEIINRRDDNEYISSARMEAEMIIKQKNREMKKEMIIYSEGDNALTEFVNPRDRGTKYLKRGDTLWMYFHEAEESMEISGHMLEQNMMGSDFSYQDMLESEQLTELYDFELVDEKDVDGRPAYVLLGTARKDKEVAYYERKIWIDQERFIGLREELFARNGRLLKVAKVKEVKEFDEGRYYPVKMVMEDQLRAESSTTFLINELEFDVEFPEDFFTHEALEL